MGPTPIVSAPVQASTLRQEPGPPAINTAHELIQFFAPIFDAHQRLLLDACTFSLKAPDKPHRIGAMAMHLHIIDKYTLTLQETQRVLNSPRLALLAKEIGLHEYLFWELHQPSATEKRLVALVMAIVATAHRIGGSGAVAQTMQKLKVEAGLDGPTWLWHKDQPVDDDYLLAEYD